MRNGPYTLIIPPEDYPGKRYRGRYAYEHHVVWWQVHGAIVPDGHIIHHGNGDKTDNRPENLSCLSLTEHTQHHAKERALERPPTPPKVKKERTIFRGTPKAHGTSSAYNYHRCKCRVCRDWKAAEQRARRVRLKQT